MIKKKSSNKLKSISGSFVKLRKNSFLKNKKFNQQNIKTSWKSIKNILNTANVLNKTENFLDSKNYKFEKMKEEISSDFILVRKRNLSKEKVKFLKRIRCKISKYYYILHVTVKYNNIFCILTDNKKRTITRARSSGSFGMKISKKNVKHNLDFFIKQYRKLLVEKGIILTNTIGIKLNCSRKHRKTLLKTIKSTFFTGLSSDKKSLIIDIKQGKPFNGCRGVKLRRKKRFKPRIFKVLL